MVVFKLFVILNARNPWKQPEDHATHLCFVSHLALQRCGDETLCALLEHLATLARISGFMNSPHRLMILSKRGSVRRCCSVVIIVLLLLLLNGVCVSLQCLYIETARDRVLLLYYCYTETLCRGGVGIALL